MSESETHRLLKFVGMAHLHNMGCKPIATEINLWHCTNFGAMLKGNKRVIDVLGVSKNPILERQVFESGYSYNKTIGYTNMLRGVEVKVTKQDFKNGFVMGGCNYLYILAPLGILEKSDIPVNVGFLEYDTDKHDMCLGDDFSFYSTALNITKKPRRVDCGINIKKATDLIWGRSRSILIKMLDEILLRDQDFKFSKRNVIVTYPNKYSGGWMAWLRQPHLPHSGRGETKIDAIIDLFTKIKEDVGSGR